jgi:hypothetical protein
MTVGEFVRWVIFGLQILYVLAALGSVLLGSSSRWKRVSL